MERNANANNSGNGGPLMSFIRQIDATGIPLLLARFILGLIFLSYGINKVADPIGFLKSIIENSKASPMKFPLMLILAECQEFLLCF